ncbi:adhesion G protein-coupled receptor L4-like [Sitophilus oryzae]|uniref:Adhesion G protein-coupled receptor L4-like n=1 Tax=Sitophilus oryzae TaxID=7048 RepID=A0A6J2XWF3_SITOR|nr:adhesion G protein-coupled receptor L4-like [Sitophilus oryzae]
MKCVDPCPGTCGVNAECSVINHNPQCYCTPGYTGNALILCRKIEPIVVEAPKEKPYVPSPCGPYSTCRSQGQRPVCSCISGYYGSPPMCKPECIINSECTLYKTCQNQKCVDPCPGICGINALCRVVNHSPICSCPQSFEGDPFIRCLPEIKPPVAIRGHV